MASKLKIRDTRDQKNRKLTRKDVKKAATRCKNWGRWGKDDEIGTLNFTTPGDIVAAAQLVRKGKVISLALNYDQQGPQGAKSKYPALGRFNPIHVMTRTGTDAYSGVLDHRKIRGTDDLVIMRDPEQDWDQVLLVEYPSRKAFIEMVSKPEYNEAHKHRESGLERTIVVACTPVAGAVRTGAGE